MTCFEWNQPRFRHSTTAHREAKGRRELKRTAVRPAATKEKSAQLRRRNDEGNEEDSDPMKIWARLSKQRATRKVGAEHGFTRRLERQLEQNPPTTRGGRREVGSDPNFREGQK